MKIPIKNIIKKILPGPLKNRASNIYFKIRLKQVQRNHKKALKKIRGKEKIKVVFLLIHESVWKYEGLYELMEKDDRFEPVVVVCPYTPYGEEVMLRDLNQAFQTFKAKGYNVIKSLIENTGEWLDVKKVIRPDLVFFTNPYSLTKPMYLISNFLDTLTFYVPYGFMITDRPQMQFNEFLHNVVFQIFHESEFHNKQAKIFSKNGGLNSTVTGYPGLDFFLQGVKESQSNAWKLNNQEIKKIIWAPHHTIELEENKFNYSTFLDLHLFMLELATEFEGRISIAFKPHPLLRGKLKKLPDWGIEKTELYYNEWRNRSNCQLNEGRYEDLFFQSDAMIHDSGSFLVEYISLNKPSLYTIRNKKILDGFSYLGNKVLECHYKSFSKKEIRNFIETVVLKEQDYLKEKRENLIKEYLQPPNEKSASQNIFDQICKIFN